MYLSQQIIFHLFNHFKTMFSRWVFRSIPFSPEQQAVRLCGLGDWGWEGEPSGAREGKTVVYL